MRCLRYLLPFAWLCAALLLAPPARAAGDTPAPAPAFPEFEAAPCCQLCPQAADVANYNTKFLDSFKTLVQGSDGWLFRSEADLLMHFGTAPEGLQRLARFHRELQRRGVELVIMVQPPRGLMHADKLKDSGYAYDPDVAQASYEHTLHDLRALGIAVPQLEKLLTTKGEEDYFWRADHHWTPDGTRRTARLVAEKVLQLPQYADVRKQRFVSRREGVLARGGTLSHAASDLCGFGGPKQYVARYVTEPADGGGEASGLLGDDSVPQITLIGTSNSGAAYNFSGFLSEYLSADVLNASVLGGGMDGAMLSYLPSEEFRKNPPKILIWELQHFHNLGDPMFYRQAMPLLDDGCNSRGQNSVLEREVALRQGANEVLFNGGGSVRQIKGRDHVLDIQFSDPEVRELRAVVWYTSGNKDTLRIEQSQHAPSQKGRFVAELRSDQNWGDQTFMALDIEVVPPEPVTAAATAAPTPAKAAAPAGPQRVRARLCTKAGAGSATTTASAAAAMTDKTQGARTP